MGNTAMLYALGRYFGDSDAFGGPTYEVRVGETTMREALFGTRANLTVPILAVFRTNELNFIEMMRESCARIERSTSKKIHIVRADWFILSDRGGIYLYEEIGKRENERYRAMRNRFVVMNSIDGTVSFGPGHPHNTQITEKMRALLQVQRALPEEIWLAEMFKVFGLCRNILAAR